MANPDTGEVAPRTPLSLFEAMLPLLTLAGLLIASAAFLDSHIATRRSCNSLQTRLIGVFVSFPLTVERAS
jgi:hypothetical protein